MLSRRRNTKHQVARVSRADFEQRGVLYLFKNCSELRLTYQIQMLTESAMHSQQKLRIEIPKHCKVHRLLRDFQKQNATLLKIQKAQS